MQSCLQSWPEPVTRVQNLSESGIRAIPNRYIKKPADRPISSGPISDNLEIPVIDMRGLLSEDIEIRRKTEASIDWACRKWGFFQATGHGVGPELMGRAREVWRGFFGLPMEEKQKYANSPATYEGYGSRLGVENDVALDWSDYFFLHYLPESIRDEGKWPSQPDSCRELGAEYSRQVVELCGKLMKILSTNLGLGEDFLQEAFGGPDELGACMRVNYYPKCPQPDLTLGLSAHSDPGGMTILFPDENVSGLQVRHAGNWVTVKPIPNAFIVNIGDQMQILSNGNYKSVEHRVIVNSEKERVSLAFFYNPKGDKVIKPAEQLVTAEQPALYLPTTFNEYRLHMRTKGPSGKTQVESLKSSQ
ncbi:2-oxoglutarate (2OG) and Fe(II)-dependent oxygenase superfamily protein [Striga asiatica]|uniref:2-oxoglutarate (2OG) and Fe(II)-dependent oxygenase superfamily protein n=1 Tax=Striga asiatica TaxID=4170 RepID=A0A5A7RF45_STRAF|nr:2-oxoglutarate (2OG) and Fe(II)-dependent oxygenase superfamily protein [Striga asiatica]